MTDTDRLAEMAAEIERLRARIIMLEAQRQGDELMAAAMRRGTLAQPTPDEPTKIENNIPPSAPPHDNSQPPIGHTIKWPSSTSPHDE